MSSYFTNQDDATSDPENIVARYLCGHNIALEVSLTLAEYAADVKSASGGSAGSPAGIATIFTETGGTGGDGGGGGGGGDGGIEQPVCPEISQRLLTKDGYERCDKIYDKHLAGEVFLFNPLTGNHNLVKELKIADAECVRLELERASLVCSKSHRIIRNTQDLRGTWYGDAQEVLTYTDNCYIDRIIDVIPVGVKQVMTISLDKEFIYVAEGVLSHNRKPFSTL